MSNFTADEQLNALFDEDYLYECRDNPEFASQSGEHEIAIKADLALQDVSPAAYELREIHAANNIESVDDLLRTGQLSAKQTLFAKLFKSTNCELLFALRTCKTFLFPINSIGPGAGGVTHSFMEHIEWMRFSTSD